MLRVSAFALAFVLLTRSSKADIVDTCAYLENFDLTAALNSKLSISSIPDIYGKISQCLCLSGINDFINQNPPATMAVSKTSASRVVDAVADILDSTSGHERCDYPDNSQAICTQNNVCGYRCNTGFQQSGNKCICSPPYRSCNGQCSPACPSGAARKRNMDLQTTMGRYRCPFGQEACGGYSGPNSYECIDIRTTLDSCGGCVFPLQGRPAGGTDCSAIAGAEKVRCINAKCAVMNCMAGWNVTGDGQSCTPT